MLGGQSGLPPRPYDGRRGAFAGLTGLGKKPDSGLESARYYRISPAGLDPDYLRLRRLPFRWIGAETEFQIRNAAVLPD